jgi:hypothetical protein
MKTLRTLTLLAGIFSMFLTGCSSLPACGTPEAKGQTCSLGLASTLADFNASQPPQRDYINNPFPVPAVQSLQPNFGNTGERFQTIMVDTPNGFVYKRCKLFNNHVVACF